MDGQRLSTDKISYFIKSEDLTLEFPCEYSKDERDITHELVEKFKALFLSKLCSTIGTHKSRKHTSRITTLSMKCGQFRYFVGNFSKDYFILYFMDNCPWPIVHETYKTLIFE
jgi:hypothetical protein